MKSLSEFNGVADTGERLLAYICRLLRTHDGARLVDGNAGMFWRMLVRLSSEQLVLTAIVDAACKARVFPDMPDIPNDVVDLLQTMEAANRNRNLRLLANLDEANAKLQEAGIKAVALKGAAFLTEDGKDAVPWRFFGDLDLLVTENDLPGAISALQSLGYIANQTAYHPHHHRHYPFLRHPDGDSGIDVHTRLAGFHQTTLLDPDDFFRTAVQASTLSPDIFIPSDTNRLAHLIVNAQVLDYRYERRLFRLRDVLDFANLTGRIGVDLAGIRRRFETYGNADAMDAYLVMMDRVLGDGHAVEPPSAKAIRWANQVEQVIRNPQSARIHILKHWIKMAWAQLFNRRERQFLIERLADTRQREEFFGKRASYLRIFQR